MNSVYCSLIDLLLIFYWLDDFSLIIEYSLVGGRFQFRKLFTLLWLNDLLGFDFGFVPVKN